MKTVITKTNRIFRLAAILAVALVATGCGDEGMMYDEDGFGSQSQTLEAFDRQQLQDDQLDLRIVGNGGIDEEQESEVHFSERLDLTKFDPLKHRHDIEDEVEGRLDLEQIERFEFDCDGRGQDCGPAGSDERGADVDQMVDENDVEDSETEENGLRGDIEFNPERHRINITTEIENKLDLERIKRFGLDCNDALNNCAPHGDRNTDR